MPTFPDGMLKEPIAEPTTNEKGEKSKWEIRRQFVEEFRRLNHYPDRYISCRESHQLKGDGVSAGLHYHVSGDTHMN